MWKSRKNPFGLLPKNGTATGGPVPPNYDGRLRRSLFNIVVENGYNNAYLPSSFLSMASLIFPATFSFTSSAFSFTSDAED